MGENLEGIVLQPAAKFASLVVLLCISQGCQFQATEHFWASENLSGRVHFEDYSPEWRVLSKLSVQPCLGILN